MYCFDLPLKDFIPLFTTLITVYAGYKFLSIQAQKNRNLQLIENLRKEIAHFYSLITFEAAIGTLQGTELISSIAAVELLLDDNEPLHKRLIDKMSTVNDQAIGASTGPVDYEGLLSLAKEVISQLKRDL